MSVLSVQGFRAKLVDKLTGTILDLFQDEEIKVSNNILELFDIGEIPGIYTQTIRLPGTRKNNAFFEHYYDISIYNPDIFNTNQKVEAYLDFDSFYLANGYIQLNKVNVYQNKFVDSYEVTLFGIISNFSVDSNNFFLTDLDGLSVYDHTSSLDIITGSWSRQLFNGDIVYPLAEYGQKMIYTVTGQYGIDDENASLNVQNFKPAIRIKKVWDEIFNSLGYTYTGSFFNQPWLDDVYLICNRALQYPVYADIDLENYGKGKVTLFGESGSLFNIRMLQTGPTCSISADSIEYDNSGFFDISYKSASYSVPKVSQLNCTLDLNFRTEPLGAGSGMPQWQVQLYSGSTLASTTALTDLNAFLRQKRANNTTTPAETQRYTVDFRTQTLQPGKYDFRLFWSLDGTSNSMVVYFNPSGSKATSLEVKSINQAADYKVISIQKNMPYGTSGIKLLDFIKGIQKKFNLVIYPDKQNPRQFIVETFNNWYKQGEIKNFNRYANLDDKIEFIPANQFAYKQLKFSDKEDNDYISTLFKRQYNRVYGESVFNDSGSFFSEGKLDVTSIFSSAPLIQIPGSVYTASLGSITCRNYTVLNQGGANVYFEYDDCENGTIGDAMTIPPFQARTVCSRRQPYNFGGMFYQVNDNGDCSIDIPSTAKYPIYVPVYISDDKYKPAIVNPRLLFFNNEVSASTYLMSGYANNDTSSVVYRSISSYPYFDNYNVITGSIPTTGSRSLLFNNEQASQGSVPNDNLISAYWNKYIGMLYNPRTRLVKMSCVIPLADYFNLELNDIAEFRGNYYHIRAINNYSLKSGQCEVELLGPIIGDTISEYFKNNPTPTPTPSPMVTPSVTPTVTPSISVTPSITPSISITPTVTPSISVTPTVTPSISVTPTVTPSISVTPSITPSITPSETPIAYVYYNATQYSSCVQNSPIGDFVIRVPVALDSGAWFCGNDGFQYEITSTTIGPIYDITAIANATPSTCINLPC